MSHSLCSACRTNEALPFTFTMAFQPIVEFSSARVWAYEALVRGPNRESAGSVLAQVNDANRYRFDQACRVKAIELASSLFGDQPDVKLSINFMPNAVYEPVACIRASLEAARRLRFPRERLMFEFTEDEQFHDLDHLKSILKAYRRQGFVTAIDDFGSGYAGLKLLADLQTDLLKLDIHLIRGIDVSKPRQTIVAATAAMARALGITLVAEGVETSAELTTLRELGIDLFQGYLFAKPKVAGLPIVNLIQSDQASAVEQNVARLSEASLQTAMDRSA